MDSVSTADTGRSYIGTPHDSSMTGGRRALIIDALLATALVALVVAVLAGVLGLREGLMAVAIPIQYTFYKARMKRGLTTRDCIVLTWLGAALLAVWLVGTWAWEAAGLPANVWL